MSAPAKKPALPALTGVRFFAALAVLILHFAPKDVAYPAALRGVFMSGGVAVGFFFVLSGFILAYNYVGRDGAMTASPVAFWRARFARIYPVSALAFFLVLPFFILETAGDPSYKKLGLPFLNLTLLQAWFADATLEFNPPAWSLSCEAFFYLLFPYTAVRLAKSSSPSLVRWMIALWVATLAIPCLYSYADYSLTRQGLDMGALHPTWLLTVKMYPLMRLPEFLIGVCLGLLYGRSMAIPSWFAPAAIPAILVACAYHDSIPFAVFHNGILDPFFILLILGLASSTSAMSNFFKQPWLVLFGEASYGLYILHHPFWRWCREINRFTVHANWQSPGFFLSYTVAMIALSVAVFKFFETPVRRAIMAWFGSTRRKPAILVPNEQYR
jgi:peptidoglycan/LPS O-acetylase OafA/YrhL